MNYRGYTIHVTELKANSRRPAQFDAKAVQGKRTVFFTLGNQTESAAILEIQHRINDGYVEEAGRVLFDAALTVLADLMDGREPDRKKLLAALQKWDDEATPYIGGLQSILALAELTKKVECQ